MLNPPFTAHKELLDRTTEQDNNRFCEYQSKKSANDQISVQAQKAGVENNIDKHSCHRQKAYAEKIIEKDASQKKREARKYLRFILFIELCAGKLYWRISSDSDGFTFPRPHLTPELNIIAQCGYAQQEIRRKLPGFRDAIGTTEEIPGHVQLAKFHVLRPVVEHVRETAIRPEDL